MSISIIIPAFNAEKYLAETLESVLAQTYPDWELILVDDGSTDGTSALAQKYVRSDRRIRVLEQPNSGVSSARNLGLSHVSPTSGYVIFLDSDDVWKADALQLLFDAAQASPLSVGVHGLGQYIDHNSQPIRFGEMERWAAIRQTVRNNAVVSWTPNGRTTFAELAVRTCIPAPSSFLIRLSAMQKAGLFDSALSICADWDMWLRLVRHGDIVFIPDVILGYRQHPSNMSGNIQATLREERQTRRKHIFSPENSLEQAKMMRVAHRAVEHRHCLAKVRTVSECFQKGQLRAATRQCGYLFGHFNRYVRGVP